MEFDTNKFFYGFQEGEYDCEEVNKLLLGQSRPEDHSPDPELLNQHEELEGL